MSLRSKAKAARQREKARAARELEVQKLEANWERIKVTSSGIRVSPGKVQPTGFLAPKHFVREVVRHPSLQSAPKNVLNDMKPTLSPEMEARERAAQLEREAKKKRTAPVYNKGGYQYLTDDMIEDMKAGTLRRR